MVTSNQLYFQALNANCRAILVEGFQEPEYQNRVTELTRIVSEQGGRVFDFDELLGKSVEELIELELDGMVFVYNMDLFGNGIDPKMATQRMAFLRSQTTTHDNSRELMIARPNANLDYNSRSGFTYHDNHPLGNWCEFYRVEEGKLVSQSNPIEHRNQAPSK